MHQAARGAHRTAFLPLDVGGTSRAGVLVERDETATSSTRPADQRTSDYKRMLSGQARFRMVLTTGA